MTRIAWRLVLMLAVVAVALTMALFPDSQGRAAAPPAHARDPQIGRSFRVPYRLTETNHFLVRAHQRQGAF